MLVLARAQGQSVVLGDAIIVTILSSRDGFVRLGIDAPEAVGVRRGELDPRPTAGDAAPGATDPVTGRGAT